MSNTPVPILRRQILICNGKRQKGLLKKHTMLVSIEAWFVNLILAPSWKNLICLALFSGYMTLFFFYSGRSQLSF